MQQLLDWTGDPPELLFMWMHCRKDLKKDGLYSELIVPDVSNKDEGGFFVSRICIQATSQNLSLTESEDSVSIHALCAGRRVFQTRRENMMGEREPLLLSRVQSTYCARQKLYHATSEGVDLHESLS